VDDSNLRTGSMFVAKQLARIAVQIALLAVLMVVAAATAWADDVVVGQLSFDTLNLGATDAFTVTNYTGDDNLGFFPVVDNVNFEGITVTYTDSTTSTTTSAGLPDLSPDQISNQLAVTASDTYSQAVFSATLSQTIFTLSDTTMFQADSSTVTFTLLPSTPPSLQADVDLGLITVSGSIITSTAPEPPVSLLLLGGMLCLFGVKRAKTAGSFEKS
jgi:hypothetical protein